MSTAIARDLHPVPARCGLAPTCATASDVDRWPAVAISVPICRDGGPQPPDRREA